MDDTYSLPKAYDFTSVEARLYAWWNDQGYFAPQPGASGKPYVISMPPPNVTGELHLGHAMFVAMEDLMIRHSRMKGVPTLWVPGTDHAGIATQLQVEKDLLRTEEVTREEIGREAFVERTWAWKRKYGGIITDQLRRLGASCDWSRERFTLDEGLSRAVREAFVRLYEKGLIYRGTYLINWSPGLRTAVSDLEVEYSEEDVTLYYFRYPLKGSDESIPVATARPETILGDTAVAVHPEDERYRHLVGKTAIVPILGREIPVIADSYVDREFGTGALKITPGHDPADYEIGQRHGLPIVSVLHRDATMSDEAGPYAGLDRLECRQRMWSDMESAGLTIRTEPYRTQIPRSQRGGEIIEPMVSTQWFVRMKPLAEPALAAVQDGRLRLVPDRFAKIYTNWLENIRDWCVSRQLWWGHRIPAWHCSACGEITVARQDPDRCAHCGNTAIEQDPDVLDTWFSSGLWPFSTLGWPDDTEDLRTFYPTTMMETGYDILFFWVARMVMMGLEFTGKLPFEVVYLHGTIRDKYGRRMSKTLGNGIDPLWILDGAEPATLPEYARAQYPDGLPAMGTDALRLTLLTGSTPGKDLNLQLEAVEANRNFANKLWNAGRLVLSAVERAPAASEPVEPTLADQWIQARQRALLQDVSRLFAAYQYGEAGRQIYEFFWGEYADWYLEVAKLQLARGGGAAHQTARIMVEILDTCLRLLHPYTPYVTEELWGRLRDACQAHPAAFTPSGGWGPALIIARWPDSVDPAAEDAEVMRRFDLVREIVRSVRNARAEKNVAPKQRLPATIVAAAETAWLAEQGETLASLARLDPDQLSVEDKIQHPPVEAMPLTVGALEVYLGLRESIDAGAESERLARQLEVVESQIERLRSLLAGPFADRAPAGVVAGERQRLAQAEEEAARLGSQLQSLRET
ncbi:MAG TPA: valine--tRNA ligase [Anaerolineales bacterium]|nr:valine--tRNA ligase [Anaerolineales bacterium]